MTRQQEQLSSSFQRWCYCISGLTSCSTLHTHFPTASAPHLEENPIFSPISHTGDLRLREMKLLVQTAQLVTREERGFEHSWPALKPGYEHHPLGMLLISFATRIQAQACLPILPSEARGQNRVEFTTSHSGPWPVLLSQENSLHKILAQHSALCPQTGEEGPQCLQNWHRQSGRVVC